MKRAFPFVLILVTLLSVGCSTWVNPGHVGIIVNSAGTDRGVSSYPTVTGRVWYNPYTEQVIEYPTFVQTAKWTASVAEGKPVDESITFTNKDGMQFSADISLSYHLLAEKVPAFYVKFRSDDINNFTHGYLRNVARDNFDAYGGRYSIEQIMGDNAEFISAVRKAVADEVKSVGVEIDQFGLIGAPRPPAQIQAAINNKAQAQQIAQQKENELKQAQADAAKVVARADGDAKAKLVWAEAEATANRRIGESLSANVLEAQRLRLLLEKWNGTLPTVNGVGVNPFMSVK